MLNMTSDMGRCEMAQERKRRPGGGTGKPGEQEGEFETVVVPPVSDISAKLGEYLKQESKVHGCNCGCWCDPCLYDGCSGHYDPILTAAQYKAGKRRGRREEDGE
jgi:hypothetical protein